MSSSDISVAADAAAPEQVSERETGLPLNVRVPTGA